MILKEVKFTNGYRVTIERLNGRYLLTNHEGIRADMTWFDSKQSVETKYQEYVHHHICGGLHMTIGSKLRLMMGKRG